MLKAFMLNWWPAREIKQSLHVWVKRKLKHDWFSPKVAPFICFKTRKANRSLKLRAFPFPKAIITHDHSWAGVDAGVDTGGRPWGQQNFICREITLASQSLKTISAQIKAMLGAIRLHCFPFLMHLPYINIDACFWKINFKFSPLFLVDIVLPEWIAKEFQFITVTSLSTFARQILDFTSLLAFKVWFCSIQACMGYIVLVFFTDISDVLIHVRCI